MVTPDTALYSANFRASRSLLTLRARAPCTFIEPRLDVRKQEGQ